MKLSLKKGKETKRAVPDLWKGSMTVSKNNIIRVSLTSQKKYNNIIEKLDIILLSL